MKDDGENVQMVLDGNSGFSLTDCSSENNDTFNGMDISTIPIDSLITSNEWQMRMYGYKKAINEIDSINVCEFENQFIKSIINDKNISSQNLGIKFMSIYIDNFGMKISDLPAIWKDNISEMLIKKTLFNQKTSISSINLAFSFFEQSLLIENGDLAKVEYMWDNMIDFINNNRKSKGIIIKQIFGIVKLFSSFIDNYGIELSPIVKWSKALLPLVSDCNDKNTKDYIYEILSMVNQESPLMELISSSLTPLQLKEVSKRSIELDEKKKEPSRNHFINKIKSILGQNQIDSSIVTKDYGNSADTFDLIEPVDVTKMLPPNWLEIISDKDVKWSERKVVIDKFCKLCETHKKLSISQNDNKMTPQNVKRTFAPTITDYQNLLNILQRIIKCEGNTALILSVIRLCSNLVNCLRGKISTIIRPLATQIMIKIKDQNKIVCTESINFINIVLKFSLSLDQIFDDLCQYGFKEKVTTAKCSAITICNYLIDEIIEKKNPLEKHLKGIKHLVNVIPSCFDDPSVQVRSSASVLLVKLKHPCFGDDINSVLHKIIMGLNNNKQKLINETEKKLGIQINVKSENTVYDKHICSKTLQLPIKTTKPPPNSTLATPNNESTQLNRKSLSKIGHCKHSEIPNNNSIDVGNDHSKSDRKSISSVRSIENLSKAVNENYMHNSEHFPTILGSISSKSNQKINFFERLSNNNTVNLQSPEKPEKQSFYYIDPTDSRNFIIKLPGTEIIFESHGSGLPYLQEYIKPIVSDNLFINMFSNNKVQVDFSISFWERFCNFLNESEHHKFTLFYFLFKWISYNIEMRIAANYERIIVTLMKMFFLQDEQDQLKYNESIIYNIFWVVVNIIIKELQIFDKSSMLSNYEISKYEKIVFLIMDKGSMSTTLLEREGKQASLNKLNNTLFLMNTVIISTLEDLENFENKINLINNHLNMINDSSNFLKNYGVSNVHSLIKFVEHNSSNVEACDSINKVLSRISSNIGVNLWNSILFYLPDDHVEKYCISNDSNSLISHLQSNLVIINSLEYETIMLFNIIGSTGDPKDIGVLLYSNAYLILRNIVTNLCIINNKLNYVLENNEIEKTLMEQKISSLLIEHITCFSEMSIHIYFILTKLETFKYLELNEIIKPGKIGELFFKIIEYLDMFTCKFQSIMTKKEFPIKEIMINTLFIMSDYLLWKEHISDEIQKVKIVNSLNNIMGVNIILSFQKELPRLINIIIEVVLFGIKPNNQTIFDIDLLNRLLPKVLRRMKVYLSKNNIEEFQIESINRCFELVINPLIDESSNQLTITIDFTLDYLLLLLESGLSIQGQECRFLNKALEKINKGSFQCKVERIKSLME